MTVTPLPTQPLPKALGRARHELGALAAVAVGADVRDVVARDVERAAEREQTRNATERNPAIYGRLRTSESLMVSPVLGVIGPPAPDLSGDCGSAEILCNRGDLARVSGVGSVAAALQGARESLSIAAGVQCSGVARVVAQHRDIIAEAVLRPIRTRGIARDCATGMPPSNSSVARPRSRPASSCRP